LAVGSRQLAVKSKKHERCITCLLFTANCLLPTVFRLLPTAFCRVLLQALLELPDKTLHLRIIIRFFDGLLDDLDAARVAQFYQSLARRVGDSKVER
jgi:hypothetical protein